MKTEQVKIYKFSELSPKVQEEVLDKMREINTDFDWYDGDFEYFKEQLKEIGLSCETFCFDLYHRSFYMSKPRIEDTRKFLLSALTDDQKLLMQIDEDEKKEFEALIDKLDEEYYYGIDDSREHNSVGGLEEVGDILGIDYNEYLKDILKGFLKQLQESYDYLCSDEAVKDTIEANEYDFLEDGERW